MRIAIIITAILCATSALSASLHVQDADTIVVDGTAVRLNGVDAPELKTSAGKDAKRWMVSFLRDKAINCDLNGERTYDRWVGVCFADGEDIGAAVIAAGHALDCRRYSGGRYRVLETAAARSRTSGQGTAINRQTWRMYRAPA
ncbi:thermonuclease family protein [Arenibacterium sp. LLYu02]|uniref:thermonuclease family protein n=1 Tax=Arenibacterium sp. LLYu02 TaxID=3404132 RepID=UPI003B2281E0